MFMDALIPWWGPGAGYFGGMMTAPQEVPLTVNAQQEAQPGKSKTGRQPTFAFNAMGIGLDGCSGGVGTFGCALDSNSTNALDAHRRANAKLPSSYPLYRRMRADGIVAIGREIADALVCTNQWSYEPRDETVKPEWVKCIREMWEGRGTFGESHEGYCLREMFLAESCRAKDFGSHTLEVVYGIEDITDEGGEVTGTQLMIDEFLPLLPETTLPLVFQGTRKFAGVRNWGMNGVQVDLEPPYCIRFVYDAEGGDLFGRSRFENFKDWWQLKCEIRDKIRTDLNISIGNIMTVEYPTGSTEEKTAENEAKAATIALSLAKGQSVTMPGISLTTQVELARATVDPSKLRLWKIERLDTGTNSFDGFKAATDLVDEQILFGLLCLPRAVREADHGSKADSEQHTDTQEMLAWKWITYVVGLANNLTDVILVNRFGKEAKGAVQCKAVPLSDDAVKVLKDILTVLLSDKSFALKCIDIKSSLEKIKIKPKADFDQEKLAKEIDVTEDLSSRERMRRGGYKDDEITKIQGERAKEDAIPTDKDGL